ncbi:leucine-rich repeat domain-containing protein [Secundilactobacillus mixtipabuli]|uniref:Cell surface protein n=1 Tax=Secundilactobacillus mixtipabuli TaxID=1435342 RepID=A0A1Z5IBW0_9LACO|nr:leucine-rich repeat domain-containing protein [Secundilactobacillus mixtipabuli]GAW99091.1 hypothetical protein IWT30_01051 [Secundilactobacillus mixtipabuli]
MIFSTLLALFVLFLFGSGQPVKAASYDDNTLVSYGIPDNVVQVMLNNSMYADGQSPTQKGQTPDQFTIKNVTQLTTISLANRMGASHSTANSTVADWVASGTANSLYDISANVYAQNTEDKVTGDSGSLATKALVFDGHTLTDQYHPAFNMLMQIVASANNATTVDLTGVTSEVTDTTLAQSLISLFQTPRLTSINKLLLGDNNLTDASLYIMGQTVMNVTDAQNLTSLDLSNNHITQLAWGRNFPITQKLTDLNMSGNSVKKITDTLDHFLQPIVNHYGTADLSTSDLDAGDWNTIDYIVSLLNISSGVIKLSDSSINAVATSNTHKLNNQAIQNAIPQLTDATIDDLLNDSSVKLSDTTKAKLQDQKAINQGGGTSTAENSVAVSGELDFGTNVLNSLDSSFTAKDSLTLNATILPGSQLTATMDDWKVQDGSSSFKGNIIFPANSAFSGNTNLNADTPAVLYTNNGSDPEKLSSTLTGLTLKIPEDQRSAVRAKSYQTSITWHVDAQQSANQQ